MENTKTHLTSEEKQVIVNKWLATSPQLGKAAAAKQLGYALQTVRNWMKKPAKKNTAPKKNTPASTHANVPTTPATLTSALLTSPVQSATGNGKVLLILGEASCVQSMLNTALERLMN